MDDHHISSVRPAPRDAPVGGRWSRRALLGAAAGAAAAFALPRSLRAARRGLPDEELRIGLVTPVDGATPHATAASHALLGIELGGEEAARTAQLFGWRARVIPAPGGVYGATTAAAERLIRESRVSAILGGFTDEDCVALAALSDTHGVLYVNMASASDALRGAGCRRHTFHVQASDAMRADALAARTAGARSAPGGSPPAVRVELWHRTLERFGAAQLNDRFRARFGGDMDSAAWAGWVAVKILWETALRARATDPAAMLAFLERDTTQFDGHKGRPLSFRAWDHQLRQSLYLVASAGDAARSGERVIAELPADEPGSGRSSRELLDELGIPAVRTACRWGS